MANLFNILEREGSPEQIGSALRPLIRRNNEAGSDIKKSLHELETIINYAQSLGVKAKIIISPGLIFQSEHFRFVKGHFFSETMMHFSSIILSEKSGL